MNLSSLNCDVKIVKISQVLLMTTPFISLNLAPRPHLVRSPVFFRYDLLRYPGEGLSYERRDFRPSQGMYSTQDH